MEEIQSAISNNNLESLEKLLENKSSEVCCWALYYAIWEMSLGENQSNDKATKAKVIVEMLLKRGADANIVFGPFCFTVFGYTCRFATVDIVKFMIDHGADVNSKDELCRCPIELAFDSGDKEKINLLLDHGVAIEDIRRLNLLHKVGKFTIKEQEELIRKLVQLGADVNSVPGSADERSNLKTIRSLIRSGNIEGKLEATSLLGRIIREGSKEMVQFLLNHGANVNGTAGLGDPLISAVQSGREAIVKLLLDGGARPVDRLLKYAVSDEQTEIVKLLLSRGFDANLIQYGRPVLSWAVLVQNREIVELLLDHGARVDRVTLTSGYYPLHFAAEQGDVEIVKILIRHGADINIAGLRGETALTIAFKHNNKALYEFMVKKIVFMTSLGLHVGKVNLDFIEAKQKLAEFKKECVDELELLKSEKLHNSTLTYFEFLRSTDIDKLAGLARNESITDVIKSNDFMIKFPLYTELIVGHLNKGSLRNRDFELFKRFVNYLSTRRIDKLPNLPFTFVCDLFTHLTDRDIAKLRKL